MASRNVAPRANQTWCISAHSFYYNCFLFFHPLLSENNNMAMRTDPCILNGRIAYVDSYKSIALEWKGAVVSKFQGCIPLVGPPRVCRSHFLVAHSLEKDGCRKCMWFLKSARNSSDKNRPLISRSGAVHIRRFGRETDWSSSWTIGIFLHMTQFFDIQKSSIPRWFFFGRYHTWIFYRPYFWCLQWDERNSRILTVSRIV